MLYFLLEVNNANVWQEQTQFCFVIFLHLFNFHYLNLFHIVCSGFGHFMALLLGVGVDVIVTAVTRFKDMPRIEGWIDDWVSFFIHNFFN